MNVLNNIIQFNNFISCHTFKFILPLQEQGLLFNKQKINISISTQSLHSKSQLNLYCSAQHNSTFVKTVQHKSTHLKQININ